MHIKKVNTAKKSVTELLAVLHLECFPSDELPDFEIGWWWIAYDEKKSPIGFAGLYPSVQWAKTGYLCRAGGVESARGKGVQKALIKARLRFARKLGYEWLVTDTRRNPASSNALISCGFKLYEPSSPWGFRNSLYFRQKL